MGTAMDTGDDSGFERRTRERLVDSAEALDGRTRSRLTAARHAALAELKAPGAAPAFRVPGIWLPLGTVAAAAVLAVLVYVERPHPSAVVAESGAVEDIEILASNDGPDLYAEDPEFYEWATGDASEPGRG
jgi:hypothetical protein